MAIHVVCPECGSTEHLLEGYSKRTIECPRCGNVYAIPTTPTNTTPEAPPADNPPDDVPATLPKAEEPKEEEGFDLVEDEAPKEPVKPKRKPSRDDDRADDEKPRRSRPPMPVAKRGSPITVVILAFFAVVFGGGTTGAAAYLMQPKLIDPAVVEARRQSRNNINNLNNNNTRPPEPKTGVLLPSVNPNNPLVPYRAMTKDYEVLPTNGLVTDTCLGANGRYLFAFVPERQRLLVFDICEGKKMQEIPTAKTVHFAASASKLFIVDVLTRKVERWDIAKLTKDLEKPALPGQGNILGMATGCASEGPILVTNTLPQKGRRFLFIDPLTLEESAVAIPESDANGLDSLTLVQATPNCSHWLASRRYAPPKGKNNPSAPAPRGTAAFFTNCGNTMRVSTPELPLGPIALAPDGKTVYTNQGAIDPLFETSIEAYSPGAAFEIPSLAVGMRIRVPSSVTGGTHPKAIQGSPEAIRRLGFVFEKTRGTAGIEVPSPLRNDSAVLANAFPIHRALYHVPAGDVIAVVPTQQDRLILARAEWSLMLQNINDDGKPVKSVVTSMPPPTFKPGTTYRYRVQLYPRFSGTTMRNVGQTGVIVTDDGDLEWEVPENFTRDSTMLGIGIYVPGGAVTTQVVKIYNADFEKPTPMPEPKPKDPMPEPKPKDPMPEPKPKDPKSEPPTIPVDVALGAKLTNVLPKLASLTPADFTGESITVPAPGPIADICSAAGGKYLVVHCPTARKIGIFETTTAKFIKTLATRGDNVLIAAGADKLMVVYPEEKVVERWSLTTFEKETDKKLDVKQTITAAAMGCSSTGPLILGGPKAQDNASKMSLLFLDLPTMKEVKIDKADGKFGVSFGSAAHLRVTPDGKFLSAWYKDLSPSGVQIVALEGNNLFGVYYPEDAGHVVPHAEGHMVGTAKGNFPMRGERSGMATDAFLPSAVGGAFLHSGPPSKTGQRKISVVIQGGRVLATLDNLPSYDGKRDPFERDAHPLTLDQRLTFIPDARVIVVIPPAGNKLHVVKVPQPK